MKRIEIELKKRGSRIIKAKELKQLINNLKKEI